MRHELIRLSLPMKPARGGITSFVHGQIETARMTRKQLLDEGTWPGKGIKLAWRGVQVGIVLLFFFGVFVVIGANWVVDRINGNSARKRAETGSA
jgi:hypothetical protein